MKLQELKNVVFANLNKSLFDLAIENIKNALAIDLYDSDLYFYMGLAYAGKKNYNCAYLCFENALNYCKTNESKDNILLEINKLKDLNAISVSDFSIIIITNNNLEYSKNCIDSIKKYNTLDNYEIIIIDNNSSDGTSEWFKSEESIKYILNSENKGIPAGYNQGINLAKETNDIFVLNNDVMVLPNSIFNLRMALYSENSIGAVSPVSNNVGYYQAIPEGFNDISEYINYSLTCNIPNDNQHDFRLKLVGYALFLKRTVLNKIGLFDEQFNPRNFEDDDISLRVLKSGHKNILCKDSFVLNLGVTNSQVSLDIFKTNENKFKTKWGFNPFYSLLIRNEIIGLLDKPADTSINVLEIGCACGATLLEIKNKYPNANLYGIELNDNAAEIAKTFATVTAENVETSSLNYDEGFFDYIIFADVLEHLNDPLRTLETAKKYLKSNGYILASIPNVLNYTVLKDLINGNWTYTDAGILDRTHLRFFTLNEIQTLFTKAQYNNLSIYSVNNAPQNNEDIDFIEKISSISSKKETIKGELTTYQYIVKAQNYDKANELLEKAQNLRNEVNFFLRKLDINSDNNKILTKLIDLIRIENISFEYIIEAVEKNTILKSKILNSLGIKCFECGLEGYVIPLLEKAYKLDPKDLEIVYNLACALSLAKEHKLALEYINSLDKSNDNIEELKAFLINQLA
ncbi:bifunctional glycosyltransferase/class I SAM-dependent methyltransferase [Clostridium sp. HBUAS56017]|uniref:bifunctional glycosyltransferase/class I SAM-dependent methyltransferase n=1 Tax=Clostridium sp. HBUAS56017 TaxID=2571128 RepID=UPI0011784788|nr:bifunctional glycosyltransferase/class I SAM-dependent methyltransferase [Clostridium sp. HBUAS56017]